LVSGTANGEAAGGTTIIAAAVADGSGLASPAGASLRTQQRKLRATELIRPCPEQAARDLRRSRSTGREKDMFDASPYKAKTA
jgi:hypothetical protein